MLLGEVSFRKMSQIADGGRNSWENMGCIHDDVLLCGRDTGGVWMRRGKMMCYNYLVYLCCMDCAIVDMVSSSLLK